jgi:hypothetical protein
MSQEIGEQVEDLGAERNGRSDAAQLIATGIEGIVTEQVAHRPPPLTAAIPQAHCSRKIRGKQKEIARMPPGLPGGEAIHSR